MYQLPFDYVTQEAEQCRVKCLPLWNVQLFRRGQTYFTGALPVVAKRKSRYRGPVAPADGIGVRDTISY